MNQSCLIIAGEKSGEDHAMTFFPKLKESLPDCKFFGVGGTELAEQGVELLYHLKDFSSMGISEVLGKIPFYFKAMARIENEVVSRNCKVAILVDFQSFNLKLARRLKKKGVKVLYYVAPQAWVWKPWRAKVIEENVHTLFTILPFEKSWFQKRGVSKIKAVMHPLMVKYQDMLSSIPKRNFSEHKSRPIRLLLLPGSRNSEVEVLLPMFLETVDLLRQDGLNLDISLVKVESVGEQNYQKYSGAINKFFDAKDLHLAMNQSDLCLASSGTVTLATGIFELPTVVAYKMSKFNEFILKMFIPYKGPASLTNIIHKTYVFPEFIQAMANSQNLYKSALRFLTEEGYYNDTVSNLAKTKKLLSGDDFEVAEYMKQVIKD